MSVLIRDVSVADAAIIADIYNHYVRDTEVTFETVEVDQRQMSRRIEQIASAYPYIVAEADGEVVGYAYAHRWKEKAAYDITWESTVYIKPDLTGGGIGQMLMDALIASCRDRGCRSLIACITATNEGSIRFHRRLGFQPVSRFVGVGYKNGKLLDVVDLQLMLT